MLFGACFAASKEVGSYLIFIDIPSIIIVVIIALAYSFSKAQKIKHFGDGAVYMGWLGFHVGLISMSTILHLINSIPKIFYQLIVYYG